MSLAKFSISPLKPGDPVMEALHQTHFFESIVAGEMEWWVEVDFDDAFNEILDYLTEQGYEVVAQNMPAKQFVIEWANRLERQEIGDCQ